MVRVLFLFLLVFMGILPVAKAIQHARISKLRRHVAICRRGNILKTFFYENGGVFSYNKNPDLPQNYKKNNALLEKFRRSPRKTACSLYLSEETNKA